MQRSRQASREARESFLIVRVGITVYAIPAARVRHVIRALDIHPVPHAPAEVLGLAGVGSEPVLILDLALMAGHGTLSSGDHPMIVVVRAGSREAEETVGLAVDDAMRLEMFDRSSGSDGERGLVTRREERDARVIHFVNLENVSFAIPRGL